MKDMNKAMRSLQESKRSQSRKLLDLLKESKAKKLNESVENCSECENKEQICKEEIEIPVVEKKNYAPKKKECLTEDIKGLGEKILSAGSYEELVKILLKIPEDIRMTLIANAFCDTNIGDGTLNELKAGLALAIHYEMSDEQADEILKTLNEEFGSKAKELNDEDPAQKKAYDSDSVKDVQNTAKKPAKIVAENTCPNCGTEVEECPECETQSEAQPAEEVATIEPTEPTVDETPIEVSVETPAEVVEEPQIIFVDIEDVDDESFTEAFTRFVKENYKNAKELKLESVIGNNGKYKFECKLTFNSGKESKVVFEAKGNLKEGKSFLRLYENDTFKHENAERSIMTATVKVENKVLSCEKLRYNFSSLLGENKKALIYGIIK